MHALQGWVVDVLSRLGGLTNDNKRKKNGFAMNLVEFGDRWSQGGLDLLVRLGHQ